MHREVDTIFIRMLRKYHAPRHLLHCVPDAVQREARSASWCTAGPGPPQAPSLQRTELAAVPGLQRTSLGSALRAARGRCAAPGTRGRLAVARFATAITQRM